MLIATYIAIGSVRDVYEARALIAISAQSSDERAAIDVQVATVNQYLLSHSNLEPLVRHYNPYGPGADLEGSVQRMRRDIKLDVKLRDYYPQFPESFTISYRHTDPQLAMQITDDLASFFNNTNEMMEKRANEEYRELDSAIAEIEGRLNQISQQRAASQASTDLNAIRQQRATLNSAIDSLNDKEYSLSQQIIGQKQQIAEQEKVVKSAPSVDSRNTSSSYGVLLVRKAQLDAQLKDYLSQYTEKNSKVIQTRTELAEINRQLGQLDSGGGQGSGAPIPSDVRELRALQRQLASLETDLTVTQREIARKRQALALLPNVDVSPGAIANAESGGVGALTDKGKRDIAAEDERGRLLSRYEVLVVRRDTMKRLNLGKGGSSAAIFQVVDRPSKPQFPVAPNKGKLMLFAIGLALAGGLVAVAAIEVPKLSTIYNHRDVEYYLGAPVVAMIPETLTPAESGIKRRLLFIRGLGILLFAVMLVPVLAAVLKKLQIFQILGK
jgi:hypothetical protein